ncbi:MAG: hypothetical protein IH965_05480 [Gemmatimonadetes bacterium]|nr:hypothetical protein [Gemmatimonadota bacterium]
MRLFVTATVALSASGLSAQQPTRYTAVAPVVFVAERFVAADLGPSRSILLSDGSCCAMDRGVLVGGEGVFRFGWASLRVGAVFGTLENVVLGRTENVLIATLSGRYHPTTWFAVGPEIDYWRSTAGVSQTRPFGRVSVRGRGGLGVTFNAPLGVPGIRGLLDLAFYVLDAENRDDRWNHRVRVLLEYATSGTPLWVRVGYREELFFSGDDVDELRGLLVSIGLRFAR